MNVEGVAALDGDGATQVVLIGKADAFLIGKADAF